MYVNIPAHTHHPKWPSECKQIRFSSANAAFSSHCATGVVCVERGLIFRPSSPLQIQISIERSALSLLVSGVPGKSIAPALLRGVRGWKGGGGGASTCWQPRKVKNRNLCQWRRVAVLCSHHFFSSICTQNVLENTERGVRTGE